jgi:site-specific recombinase XerD
LSAFHNNQRPAELSKEQIQDYMLYNIQDKKLSWSSCNVLFCGLKKYYREYLGRELDEFYIPPRTRSKKIPMLLSKKEVSRLLKSPTNLKHKALLATVYSSGLRVSEVVKLKPRHIESDRMMIRVEDGKGRKDRYTVLSQTCLELLREHYRANHPGEWMFFGRDKKTPMSIGTAQQRAFYHSSNKERFIIRPANQIPLPLPCNTEAAATKKIVQRERDD